ncbi:MAG: DUF1566 domain-containing protein [Bacteroidaceae bacterium]|nr:DUF1566 domain-containing protein [Bacteroidaceae bacterium]
MAAIDSAALLKANKEALVAQLKEIFPNEGLNYNTPMSELTKYMQWAGGLLDVQVAVIRNSDSQYEYFDLDYWANTLTANARRNYAIRGVRLRAEGRSFVIGLADASTGIAWWPNTNVNVAELTDYASLPNLYGDFDGAGNTAKILQQKEDSGVTSNIAASVAVGYQAFNTDNSSWVLPAIGQLFLMFKYKAEINAVLSAPTVGGTAFASAVYWSSTEYNASHAWTIYMLYGYIYYTNGKTNTYRVRAISAI